MPRLALSLPAAIEEITPFQDSYVWQHKLRTIIATAKQNGESPRYWSFGGIPTTIALPDNRFAKSLDAFTDHAFDDRETDEPRELLSHAPIVTVERDYSRFVDFLDECSESGVARPSGYADVFHETFYSPKVRWSINVAFADCFAGGWQWCERGVYRGTYRKYDITSAYLWSAAQGMPDTTTFRKSRRVDLCRGDVHGLFRVELHQSETARNLPSPFDRASECLATDTEIQRYNLPIRRIVAGVVWRDTVSGDPIIRAVRAVSFWKQAARCYWGRWAQTASVTCHARDREWKLGNPSLNIVWAHTILSRVKLRLWEAGQRAIHVYVDSLITPDELPVGPFVGDWRLEKTYEKGVIIRGPGQYGDIGESKLERMAGVAKDSPKRSIIIH